MTLPAFPHRPAWGAMLLAALAGALTLLSFAPFGWWPLQFLTLAALFWRLSRPLPVRQAFLLGWAYGFGWVTSGVYWLYISMHDYGGLPGWLAVLAVGLLGLLLGAFAALACGLTAWLRLRRPGISPPVLCLLVLPALWCLSEWLRGWVFTGFPWVVSGYAHTSSPLAGFAPLLGVYGLGWLAALVAGCLALLPSRRLPLLGAAVLLAAGAGLQAVEWTRPSGQPLTVALLQGNIPQEMKFAPEQIRHTLDLYHDMITSAPADLIVTPETALPLLTHQLPPDYLPGLQAFARKSDSHLAIGLPVSDGPEHYANSVLGFSPQSSAAADGAAYRYDKHHLVPFGEFIPPGARWFVDMMHIPLGDFSRGATLQAPFSVKDQQVLPNICYEDLFGEEIADQIAAASSRGQAPSILLNMSNIAWFGHSLALPQHLQISRMRSLETGRPMLRATNTGMTAVIDARGKIVDHLAPLQRGRLQATVQGYTGLTPYVRMGNGAAVGIACGMLALAWLWPRRRRPS